MKGSVADRQWVADLEAALRRSGDPTRAAAVRAYLHSELTHLGVDVPTVRRTVRDAVAARRVWRAADVVAVAGLLWRRPLYELRLAAVELLVDRVAVLEVGDLAVVEGLLRNCHTWALVDPLAIGVAGPLLERCATPEQAAAWRQRWIADDDLWLRRSALLSHLAALRRGAGDFAAFGRLADQVLHEREFFIRKAIGWVLRDTGRRRPELVAAWVAPRWDRLSGVTRREVAKVVPTPAALAAPRRGRSSAVGP